MNRAPVRKYFFLEKKKIMLSRAACKKKRDVRRHTQQNKSFLVLFFKKELLISLACLRLAKAGTAFLSASGFLVDRCPRPALRFLFGNAPVFVAFGNMIGLAYLLAGVARLVTAWHGEAPAYQGPKAIRAGGVPLAAAMTAAGNLFCRAEIRCLHA
jgi:hypothetical protein